MSLSPSLPTSPVWFVALPLLLAFLSPMIGRARLPLLGVAQLALLALALSLWPQAVTAPLMETIVIAPPLGIHLHADAVSLLLVALFSLAGAITAAFVGFGRRAPHWDSRPAFVLVLLLIAGCNGMVLTGDLFNLYVFLEIAGVSAYALAALRRDGAALEAGLKYLLVGSVAGLFVLFAIVLIYLATGSLNLAAVARDFGAVPPALQVLIGLLLLVGLGIKAEQFPFNFWVPDIYRGSDPEASALFSGVVVKAFLFVLFHAVFMLLADPAAVRIWLMGLGTLTMLAAEWTALKQTDLRRTLAYSSLGQVGLIALALGFGSEAVAAGGLFHMVNHTLVKLLLFLVAALMIGRFLSGRDRDLAGAAHAMPLAAGLFVLAALSVLGLPPLAGFASKLWILSGFAEAGVLWPILPVLFAALLEAAYYFRWIALFYRSPALAGPAAAAMSGGGGATAAAWPAGTAAAPLAFLPLLVLAVLLLGLGLAPFLVEQPMVAAAHALLDRQATIGAVLGANP